MKLNISEPIIVSRGPDSQTAGWGPYQFPALTMLPDGRILCKHSVGADSCSEYGKKKKGNCHISEDGGHTWAPADLDDYALQRGILLPNGDRIRNESHRSIPVTEDMDFGVFAGFVKRKAQNCYRVDSISEDLCAHTWNLARVKAGSDKEEIHPVKLNWDNQIIRVCQGYLVQPINMGVFRVGPDGTLWTTHYDIGNGPEDNKFTGYLANYLLRSNDNGYTWDLAHYLPYDPEKIPHPDAANWEGFGENNIAFNPDGSMIRLVRTNGSLSKGSKGAGLLYIVRSEDNGKTWSEPEIFDRLGVWPRLLTLGCGVTLAAYGRPGFYVRATSDPSCKEWEDPIEIIHADYETMPRDGNMEIIGTCSYSDMIALDDRTALLAHSDFTIKDENGISRKTIVVRYITVEQDEILEGELK